MTLIDNVNILGLILYVDMFILIILCLLEIIFVMLGVFKKDFILFRQFGKYILCAIGTAAIVIILQGLFSVLNIK